jgi:hypothetical protein
MHFELNLIAKLCIYFKVLRCTFQYLALFGLHLPAVKKDDLLLLEKLMSVKKKQLKNGILKNRFAYREKTLNKGFFTLRLRTRCLSTAERCSSGGLSGSWIARGTNWAIRRGSDRCGSFLRSGGGSTSHRSSC